MCAVLHLLLWLHQLLDAYQRPAQAVCMTRKVITRATFGLIPNDRKRSGQYVPLPQV